MKKYQKPVVEEERVELSDIIALSSGDGGSTSTGKVVSLLDGWEEEE